MAIFFYALMTEGGAFFSVNNIFQSRGPDHLASFAEKGQMIRIAVMKIIFLIQLIPVSYYGYKKLISFRDEVSNFYADTENKTLSPIRKLLVLFILFALFCCRQSAGT